MFRNWERSSPGRDENQSLSGELLLFSYLSTQSRQTIYSPDLRKPKGRAHMNAQESGIWSSAQGPLTGFSSQLLISSHLRIFVHGLRNTNSSRLCESCLLSQMNSFEWSLRLTVCIDLSPKHPPLFLKLDGKLADETSLHPTPTVWHEIKVSFPSRPFILGAAYFLCNGPSGSGLALLATLSLRHLCSGLVGKQPYRKRDPLTTLQ